MKKRSIKSLQREIREILKETPGVPIPRKLLSKELGIHKKDYHIFEKALQNMVNANEILNVGKHQYSFPQKTRKLVGELRTTRAGYGFVIVDGQEMDIFIARHNLNTAFDRDTVEVQLYAASRGKRLEGFITKIIERFRAEIVGTFRKTDYYAYVIPDDRKIYRDIIVTQDETQKAKDGQKVLLRFEKWDSDRHNPEGTIVHVLGEPDDKGVDVISIAYSFNLPTRFPGKIEEEAETVSGEISRKDLDGRLDLRDLLCFTIDPEDARDFDDAVSLEKKDNGNLHLGVHIDDVSHYVEQDSTIDKEALKRATSVYLVDRVIPMLPEHLSNNLCSLKPETDRLTFSCLMELDATLQVVNYSIQPSIIHSKRRFNYEEVQAIANDEIDDPLKPVIDDMMRLSQRLTKKRFAEGGIDFETPEVRFILDEKGQPSEIIPKKRLDSHRLVEEFMLMANQTVALHIKNISPDSRSPLPFLYRVHEKPDAEKMAKFFDFLSALNIPFKPVKRVTSKYFQEILESIKGTKEELIIEEVALRSMMKAVYSEKNQGHFGLGFQDYTHFTSPIRRYPDLTVHRLLKQYDREARPEKGLQKKLAGIAEQSTKMERLAMEAERESIKLKQVEYISKYMGEIFKGLVSGVTSFGIFVELEETYIEGLVAMTNMKDDFYIFDEKTYSLIGRETGQVIRLGDEVSVRVDNVNVERKEIDFSLMEVFSDNRQPQLPQTPKKKRRRRKRSK
jgi:ribonuclease R